MTFDPKDLEYELSDADPSQIARYTYSEKHNAQRVVVVGGVGSCNCNHEIKEIVVEKPVVVKEIQVVEIEKPVAMPNFSKSSDRLIQILIGCQILSTIITIIVHLRK